MPNRHKLSIELREIANPSQEFLSMPAKYGGEVTTSAIEESAMTSI
jgi:hypothetical protein